MRVLVTGGCGYVGTVLTEALLARTPHGGGRAGHDVVWQQSAAHPRLTVLTGDVRRIDEIDLAGYDSIIHLANIANDPSVELNPYASWEVNVLAGMRLIDRAARQGVTQFVYASSASVYGVKSETRVTEELELLPLSEYNKTKMVAERVVLSYADSMVTTIIRPATVCGYSPRMRLDVVVNMLTMQALTKGVVTVLGGAQTRPNIHVDYLGDLYLFALETRLEGVYNAGVENLSVLEIAEAVTRQVPAAIEIKPSDDPRSYSLCSDKLLATGFGPKKNVEMAIRGIAEASRDGRLKDEPICYNVRWMRQHNFG